MCSIFSPIYLPRHSSQQIYGIPYTHLVVLCVIRTFLCIYIRRLYSLAASATVANKINFTYMHLPCFYLAFLFIVTARSVVLTRCVTVCIFKRRARLFTWCIYALCGHMMVNRESAMIIIIIIILNKLNT